MTMYSSKTELEEDSGFALSPLTPSRDTIRRYFVKNVMLCHGIFVRNDSGGIFITRTRTVY